MKANGFTFIETLMSFMILFTMIFTIVPIYQVVKQKELSKQFEISLKQNLHDELLKAIHLETLPKKKLIQFQHQSVEVNYEMLGPYIQICGNWQQELHKERGICIYGIKVP